MLASKKICWVEFHLKFGPFFHFWEIPLFLWQSKTMLKYVINLKIIQFLERGYQELSIGGLISLILFSWVEFQLKNWPFYRFWCANLCKMCKIEISLSSSSSSITNVEEVLQNIDEILLQFCKYLRIFCNIFAYRE